MRTPPSSTETPAITWPAPPPAPELAPKDVHVWAAPLVVEPNRLADFAATLSAKERERAEKFRFERLRDRYIAARGFLRGTLGRYLTLKPEAVEFEYSRNGKPMLARDPNTLQFNLAHCDNVALLAVTRVGPVGVDVEKLRPVKDAEDLVARFFSSRENELFQSLPEDQQTGAFFNLWTRKEALLKATGEGIGGGLNRVEVSFLPDEPARLLAMAGDAPKAAEWSLEAFVPAQGFVGAVAVKARGVRVHCWRW